MGSVPTLEGEPDRHPATDSRRPGVQYRAGDCLAGRDHLFRRSPRPMGGDRSAAD